MASALSSENRSRQVNLSYFEFNADHETDSMSFPARIGREGMLQSLPEVRSWPPDQETSEDEGSVTPIFSRSHVRGTKNAA